MLTKHSKDQREQLGGTLMIMKRLVPEDHLVRKMEETR